MTGYYPGKSQTLEYIWFQTLQGKELEKGHFAPDLMFSRISAVDTDPPGQILGLYGQYTDSDKEGIVNTGIITKSQAKNCQSAAEHESIMEEMTQSRNELLGYFIASMVFVIVLLMVVVILASVYVMVTYLRRKQKTNDRSEKYKTADIERPSDLFSKRDISASERKLV